jgi:hypothetical protein
MRWLGWCLSGMALVASAADLPLIFPEPQKMKVLETNLAVDEQVPILVPNNAGPADLGLARELAAEFSDRYGLALRIARGIEPADPAIPQQPKYPGPGEES